MIKRRAVVLVAAVLLAGCSGVPTSSHPHVIATLGGGVGPSPAVPTPAPGADPRQIVAGFLDANASEDANHTAARSYLTKTAAKKWVPSAVTVVDRLQVGLLDQSVNPETVPVTGSKLGTLDANGQYTPNPTSGAPPTTWNFPVEQVDGQWRISAPPVLNSLLVAEPEFTAKYRPHPIYFLDQTQTRLVPDQRYSALDAQSLCNWLLDQLSAGPPQDLLASVNTAVPDQGPHASVTFGPSTVVVDVPGSSQLDGQTKLRLAAQLAYTFSLNGESEFQSVSLTDGTKPVVIASTPNPFSTSDFTSFVPRGSATLYYVRNGAVVDSAGHPVAGEAGNPNTGIDAVAIARRGPATLSAVTRGKATHEQLWLGSLGGTLTPTIVPAGSLTRPVWAPGLNEVWIGAGTKLLRVSSSGATATPVTLAQSNGSVSGQLESVAFSPDGVRVALVIASGGNSRLWIGTINRVAASGTSTASVTIDNLHAITPTGLVLSDVAWNDETTLYAVGQIAPVSLGRYGVWSVQVDGSVLNLRSVTNLPGQPDSIAACQCGLPWVSVKSTIWEQGGPDNAWTAPGGGLGTTFGSNPNYLE